MSHSGWRAVRTAATGIVVAATVAVIAAPSAGSADQARSGRTSEPAVPFARVVAQSWAAAKQGLDRRCFTDDPESDAAARSYRVERVRQRWVWLVSIDERSEFGDFATFAGRDLQTYTQFSRPISSKGKAKLRRIARPDAIGTRNRSQRSEASLRNEVFSVVSPWPADVPRLVEPGVYEDTYGRWFVRDGRIVRYTYSKSCTFTYGDIKVPALGKDGRYLSDRWLNRHRVLLGKHLPLDTWQYEGRMR